tara:strand:- start:20010 stop:20570 length:561 start_codon:yes stop_codon:yes gene_type:complete
MDPPSYENWPLTAPKSFRLFTISEEIDGNTTIACTLSSFDLDKAPPYIALSYTWGTADDKQKIALSPGNSTLLVTKTCHSALGRLRKCYCKPDSTVRHFWIDAICIDQSNVQERNTQVAMMADIYRTASRVVIDVGEMEDSSGAEDALYALVNLEGYQDDDNLRVLPFSTGALVRDSVHSFYQRSW